MMRIKITTAKKDDPIYQEGITLSHLRSKRIHSFRKNGFDNVQALKGFKQQSDKDKNE